LIIVGPEWRSQGVHSDSGTVKQHNSRFLAHGLVRTVPCHRHDYEIGGIGKGQMRILPAALLWFVFSLRRY